MVEFTSQSPKTHGMARLLIALGVSAFVLIAGFFYVRYQQKTLPPAGSAAISVPGVLRAGDTNFEYYKTRIRIDNVRATLGISFNGARIAIISGIIFNDGDRKLEALEMHITLYDVWGKLSKERTAYALRPGAGITGESMKPLEKRGFAIGIESVEQYWDPKQVTYEITGLKYE